MSSASGILLEAFQSGARVCDVARRHDVACGLIYQWRRAALRQRGPTFVPAVVVDGPAESGSEPGIALEVELSDGVRLRIFASASPALAAAAEEGRRVSVSSLCIAAAVPTSTAYRSIQALGLSGDLHREKDSRDRRRSFVYLAPHVLAALRKQLDRVADELGGTG